MYFYVKMQFLTVCFPQAKIQVIWDMGMGRMTFQEKIKLSFLPWTKCCIIKNSPPGQKVFVLLAWYWGCYNGTRALRSAGKEGSPDTTADPRPGFPQPIYMHMGERKCYFAYTKKLNLSNVCTYTEEQCPSFPIFISKMNIHWKD